MKRAFVLAAVSLAAFTAFAQNAITAPGQSSSRNFSAAGNYRHVKGVKLAVATPTPPSDADCRQFGNICYSPQNIRRAYGLNSLLDAGFTGKGQTIVIIDSFGSPTITADLQTFDQGYGLPDPPAFQVLSPLGTVPFDPTNSDMVGWAFEATLDVQWSHANAPQANIVLLTQPVSETEGVQGMPQMLALINYALVHKLGKIISLSWGATENTLFTAAGQAIIQQFEATFRRARREGVTILVAAGDSGAADVDVNDNYYPFAVVDYPASSPQVTAIGGTSLYANENGRYLFESVWNNATGAGAGGVSQLLAEPSYQQSLPAIDQQLLGAFRGIPDLAYNADPFTAVLVYISFLPGGEGYYFIGGTSEGAPQWAGIVADINQQAGHPVGFLNRKLYRLGAAGALDDTLHDVKFGFNDFAYGALYVTGYNATAGWDLTTGWGTPKLQKLANGLSIEDSGD